MRGFADEVERGASYAVVDDEAIAGAPPQGRPHLVNVRELLGLVAMFAASNFPFAFSVPGGYTASALAAGCTVLVKAHPGHPGSVRGGLALQAEAQKRPRPMPSFGELGSINPVVILPTAFGSPSVDGMAHALALSMGMSCGQLCTSPGLIVAQRSARATAFIDALAREVGQLRPHAMLYPGIRGAHDAAVAKRAQDVRVTVRAHAPRDASEAPAGFLAQVNAQDFIGAPDLHEEIFGPAALVVVADSTHELEQVLQAVGGSLTVTLWGAESPNGIEHLIRTAMQVAGRLLFKGVPTGVAVTSAQHHGGPYPSSTEPATTSVGCAALNRFLRPVALQEPPAWMSEPCGRPL